MTRKEKYSFICYSFNLQTIPLGIIVIAFVESLLPLQSLGYSEAYATLASTISEL